MSNNETFENVIEIASQAHQLEKQNTKSHAFQSLMSLIEGLDLPELSGHNERDLVELYSHFLPKPVHKKAAFDWVAQAMAKDNMRYFLEYVFVNKEHIVASDGHRLHCIPNTEGLKPGYYDKKKKYVTGENMSVFPDYEYLISPPSDKEYERINVKELKLRPYSPGAVDHLIIINDHHYNYKYFLEIVGKSNQVNIILSDSGTLFAESPEHTGGRVVLMPVRK